MNLASSEGQLEVVKYLYEIYHSDVETKDHNRNTPINNASENGHFEVVKYLYETYHADVETKSREYELTPMNNASINGNFEVVQYLYETCHAKITEKTIAEAKTERIKEYLRSKQ